MQERNFRGTRCQVCTGCGRCSPEKKDITVVADGGLTGFWQEKIGKEIEKQRAAAGAASSRKHQADGESAWDWLAAVDIGTTTIAMVLFDREGQERDRFVSVNPQVEYGADVISRIEKARDPIKAAWMQESVKTVLEEGIAGFCETRRSAEQKKFPNEERLSSAGRRAERGKFSDGEELTFVGRSSGREGSSEAGKGGLRVVIAANTTMMYLLAGWDTKELGQAPFQASHLGISRIHIAGQEAVLLPGLSAFIGADILAGIYACGMAEREEITLLIDLGTNGEIVLGNRDRMIACATAAGPAFEGGATRGIWGADMVSLAARLLQDGILDETGLLSEPYFENGIRIGDVKITEQQIRQFQTAKAAIAAGIKTLAELYGLKELSRIGRVVLAGGFGYYLKAEDAAQVGLLPKALASKVVSAGNTALAGVLRFGYRDVFRKEGKPSFLGEEEDSELKETAERVEIVNLAKEPRFSEYYLGAMYLEEWENRL